MKLKIYAIRFRENGKILEVFIDEAKARKTLYVRTQQHYAYSDNPEKNYYELVKTHINEDDFIKI
jgi:transposase-like protein